MGSHQMVQIHHPFEDKEIGYLTPTTNLWRNTMCTLPSAEWSEYGQHHPCSIQSLLFPMSSALANCVSYNLPGEKRTLDTDLISTHYLGYCIAIDVGFVFLFSSPCFHSCAPDLALASL